MGADAGEVLARVHEAAALTALPGDVKRPLFLTLQQGGVFQLPSGGDKMRAVVIRQLPKIAAFMAGALAPTLTHSRSPPSADGADSVGCTRERSKYGSGITRKLVK